MSSHPLFPFRAQAILVRQPFGEFYVASIPAPLLRTVAYSEIAQAIQEKGEEIYEIKGTERIDDKKRHEKIGEFIDTAECTFPGSIILAANYLPSGVVSDDDQSRWRIEVGGDGTSWITIPSEKRIAAIVDGQHRIHGFDYAKRNDTDSIELACSVFFDLPNPFQAYVFATVNYNQKRVDRGLAFELFGFDVDEEEAHQWTPEKLAVFLCRKLNSEVNSPLHDRIRISAQDSRYSAPDAVPTMPGRKVSTATVVDGILSLFSSNPLKDRNTMHRRRDRRTRRDLSTDTSPLRSAYVLGNDLLIYTIIKNYFSAAKSVLWDNAPSDSYILKTVGIQACFDVLRSIVGEFLDKKVISADGFMIRLKPVESIDFSDQFFQASGIGRVRLRNTILLALKKSFISGMPERDRADYARLIQTP